MKCGKQIKDSQVFCDDCLFVMKQFPVKPDTHVQLPNRPEPTVRKAASKKKPLSQKEQNRRLRKTVRWLLGALACTLLVLAITASALVHALQDSGKQGTIGKNYNTVNTETGGK